MNITIYSSTYLPNVGGLENIMSGLADEWIDMGNSVQVFTETPAVDATPNFKYLISRKPSLFKLYNAAKQSDIYLEANLSLKTVIIGLLLRKKWVVIHHLPYTHGKTITGYIKQWLTHFSTNYCVSKYVQDSIAGRSVIIPNFYNPVFDEKNKVSKPEHTAFVGRLVSDKGLGLLIEAFSNLKTEFPDIQLSVFGDGPDKEQLIQLATNLAIIDRIQFNIALPPDRLANELSSFKWLVIPSIWEEPFGIVALEGLASGCKVIAANGGGLPDVVGKFGLLFKRGDKEDLVRVLRVAYSTTPTTSIADPDLQQHLRNHNSTVIARLYLQYFNQQLLS